MIKGKITKDTRFNLYFLGIHLPLYLIAGTKLGLGHHIHIAEHVNAFLVKIAVENDRRACLAVKTTTRCLTAPLIAVTVAVETDGFAVLDVFAYNLYKSICGKK